MARRAVEVDGRTYIVSPLETPGAGSRHCALLTVELSDETTGRAPRAPVSAMLTDPVPASAAVRFIEPGTAVVSGRAEIAFTPQLATTGRLGLSFSAPGFTRRDLSVTFACRRRVLALAASGTLLTLDSNANLAQGQRLLISTLDGVRVEFNTIAALGPGANEVTLAAALNSPYPIGGVVQPLPAAATLDLHRCATVVAGRIQRRIGPVVQPLANAIVRVRSIWRQMPPAGAVVAPEPPVPGGLIPPPPWDPPLAAIWPPAYANLAASSAVEFEDRPVDGTMSAKTLLDDAVAGASELRFSDALNLALGDVVAVDADDDGRREILEVVGITLATTSSNWATIRLNQPLALDHRRGGVIRRLGPTAPALVRALNYAAARGDEALFLDTRTVTGTHQIRVVDPGPPVVRTYHRLSVLATTSDAAGFYRLPPLARAGKIELFARDQGSAAQQATEFVPDYGLVENPLDIIVN
jgi:hypothetical protein